MPSNKLAAALVLALGCYLAQHQPVGARSMLNAIPGAELVRELSNDLLQTMGDIFDTSLASLGGELSALNPHLEQLGECADGATGNCAPLDPDAKRNVSEIIRSRGFDAQEFDVTTRDGYILTIQRIVNPLIEPSERAKLKPVILQHGLMSSSVDWVINSVSVYPEKYPKQVQSSLGATSKQRAFSASRSLPSRLRDTSTAAPAANGNNDDDKENSIHSHQQHLHDDSQQQPNSLGFYLANQGYDVFLTNSRGNVYGQRHTSMSSWSPKFWDFTFDEQIKFDLPDTIEFVQRLTNQTKVGYVGHSQGTTMIFGLLADQPEYADVIEPVVALAPVAFVDNCISPVKYFAAYTPLFQHVNMWFGSSNVAVRYLAPKVCGPKLIRKEVCANLIFLSCGFDEAEFNDTRASAYLAHMPSGTSVKNIAHWGQEVLSGRFAHFDHGILANQIKYGQAHAPDYDLAKIRSKSIALFTAENDWLASPKDVARLKESLRVPLLGTYNITESVASWNHIDFVYGKDCGRLVNARILDLFNRFRG